MSDHRLREYNTPKDYLFVWVRKNFREFLNRLGDDVKGKFNHPEALVDSCWDNAVECRRCSDMSIARWEAKCLDKNYDAGRATQDIGGAWFYLTGEKIPYHHAVMVSLLRAIFILSEFEQMVYPPRWVADKYPKYKKILEDLEKEVGPPKK